MTVGELIHVYKPNVSFNLTFSSNVYRIIQEFQIAFAKYLVVADHEVKVLFDKV